MAPMSDEGLALRLREDAQAIARTLVEHVPTIDAICLFGSVARGDANEWSDIDLLVVGRDDRLTRRDLVETLPEPLRMTPLSLLYYRTSDFDWMEESDLFVEHFRREGVVLHDGTGRLTQLLSGPRRSHVGVRDEVTRELEQLRPYEDLGRFGDNLLFCLSHLYAIGKSIAIAQLASQGVYEFNRDLAFEKLRIQAPEMARAIDTITELRPFYELVTKHKEAELPFPYRRSQHQARAAIRAIKSLADAPDGRTS